MENILELQETLMRTTLENDRLKMALKNKENLLEMAQEALIKTGEKRPMTRHVMTVARKLFYIEKKDCKNIEEALDVLNNYNVPINAVIKRKFVNVIFDLLPKEKQSHYIISASAVLEK